MSEQLVSQLKELREGKGVSQMQLALRAGVSLSTVSNMENYRNTPSIDTFAKLAQALGAQLALEVSL